MLVISIFVFSGLFDLNVFKLFKDFTEFKQVNSFREGVRTSTFVRDVNEIRQ